MYDFMLKDILQSQIILSRTDASQPLNRHRRGRSVLHCPARREVSSHKIVSKFEVRSTANYDARTLKRFQPVHAQRLVVSVQS